MAAFIAGSVDWICHIEPYATQALEAVKGSNMISDGTDVYHKGYTDCVLAARTGLINENRAALKALIKGLLIAQKQSEENRASCVRDTVGKYYKASEQVVLNASVRQPNVVDQRGQAQFMMDRSKSTKELGYVDKLMDKNAFDWTLLQEVIAENKSLYDSLKLKT